ncbi:MAG: SDR family oxidoreductase [Vicinamibacterales bacterium]
MNARVVITGGTGYVGRPLIEQLVARGNDVTALARPESRVRVPNGAQIVEGSALLATDIARALSPRCTLVVLAGTPRPNPFKARQFLDVDLAAARAAAEAAERHQGVGHIVYVSVAHPAPVMKAYIDARVAGERLLGATGIRLTILRPWYVLGPGHRWPYGLVPMYWLLERVPPTRASARRLGLVTRDELVLALVRAIEQPASRDRIIEVPEIRKSTTF